MINYIFSVLCLILLCFDIFVLFDLLLVYFDFFEGCFLGFWGFGLVSFILRERKENIKENMKKSFGSKKSEGLYSTRD